MQITEAVLKELGFEQQNPPHIWVYTEPHLRGQKHSSLHWSYRLVFNKTEWNLTIREYKEVSGYFGSRVQTVMEIMRQIDVLAHAAGVAKTQAALHQALGLDKLKQDILDRLPRDDD